MVVAHYRNKGYIEARVGAPELKTLEDSPDGKTRWIQVQIPVTEGPRYRVGEFTFDGNTVVKSEGLRPLFKLEPGEWYSEKRIRDGLREGAGGLRRRRLLRVHRLSRPEAASRPPPDHSTGPAEPTVDVTMRMQEGEQYFVNRITFIGNTTTRDNVIRREMRLIEGGVFNTEALKYQRPAPEPARLLQAARRGRPGHRRREDAQREEQGRRHAEAGGAEPQPADVRRRRLAVRGLLRAAVVPDGQLPGPRRDADAVAAGRVARRRTTRWRSPSRSCSTATSPAASTSTSGR